MDPASTPLPAVGRILLALIFVLSGFGKIGTLAATSANMASHGVPLANVLVWGAIALELGGGLALMFGLLTRLFATLFFFYLLALAVMFHAYWTMSGAAAHTNHSAFFEHLGMMGGMLYVAAFGSGPYSIDALIWRHRPVPQPAE